MISNSSTEIAALHRQQLVQRGAAALLVVGQDHLAHAMMRSRVEEHVLGAAKADAFGAELARGRASSGVSALARTFMRRTLSAQPISVAKSPASSGSSIGTAPAITSPGRAVDGDDVALLHDLPRAT
jgi:hypothetical protein